MRKLIILSLILIAGCRANNTDNAPPSQQITVSLSEINFGESFPGYVREIPVVIQNTGQLLSTVTLPANSLSSAPFELLNFNPGAPVDLLPQEFLTVTVRFTGQSLTSPPTPENHQDSIQISTTVPETPLITIPVTGTSSEGSVTSHSVSVGSLSEPSEHDDQDIIFVNGTADGLVRYDSGTDLTLSMTPISDIIQPAFGRPGSKVALLVRDPGQDGSSYDDLLTLVTIEANSFTLKNYQASQVSGEGGFSANIAGRPVELQTGVFAILSSGTDTIWNNGNERITFLNTNSGSISNFPVGFINDTSPACRLSGNSHGTVGLSSSGGDANWGDSNDEIWLVQYDATTDVVESSVSYTASEGLDESLSQCVVWESGKAVYLRNASSGMDLVDIDLQAEESFLNLSNVGGPPVLSNVASNAIWGEWMIPTTTDQMYLISNFISQLSLNDTSSYPGYSASPDSEIISAFRPTGIAGEYGNMEIGSQTLGLASGGVLNVLTNPEPVIGPLNLTTISVSSTALSGRPDPSDNREWAALSSPNTNEVKVVSFLEAPPFIGSISANGLGTSLVSRALFVGNSIVVVLSDTNDQLIRIDLPIP